MKPLILTLDYTKTAKKCHADGDTGVKSTVTYLSLDFANGENFMTGETHPNVTLGRAAAQRPLNRHSFTFIDRTKE